MSSYEIRNIRKYHIAGAILAFVLLTTCCGGDYWMQESTKNYGLWRQCIEYSGAFQRSCTDIDTQLGDHALRSERALTIISTVTAALAAVIAFLCIFQSFLKPKHSSFLLVVASVAGGIALALFTFDKYKEINAELSRSSFGWSWYCGWAGVLFGFIFAFFGCCVEPAVVETKKTVQYDIEKAANKVNKQVSFHNEALEYNHSYSEYL